MPAKVRDVPHLDDFDKQLGSWTDERILTREAIRALYLFVEYIVNLGDEDGWEYSGHSFKRSLPLSTLVIKAVIDDTYVVSFISGRTFLNYIRIFLRHVNAGTLEWRRDKYRA